jgi:hypothetical protein
VHGVVFDIFVGTDATGESGELHSDPVHPGSRSMRPLTERDLTYVHFE